MNVKKKTGYRSSEIGFGHVSGVGIGSRLRTFTITKYLITYNDTLPKPLPKFITLIFWDLFYI
jgi:hypothetical protein